MWKALLLLLLLAVAQGRDDILNDVKEDDDEESVKTLDIENDKEPIDGKLLLQRSLALSNQVKRLTDEIYSLEAAINATDSPYFAQLAQMTAKATEMETSLGKLVQQLGALNERQEKIDIQEQNISRMFTCMAQSECVTREPTTQSTTTTTTTVESTATTTVEPAATTTVESTTTIPLDKCPDVKAEPVTTFSQLYVIPESKNIHCSDVFSAAKGTINFGVHVVIAGKGAALTFFNAVTGELIQNITETNFSEIESKAIRVRIEYSADQESSIEFNLAYSAAEVDVCHGFDCKNGKCVVESHTGQPMCQCPVCDSGAHCEKTFNACTAAAKRKCKIQGGKNCVPDEDIKDYCAFKCVEKKLLQKPWLRMWKNMWQEK